MKKILILLSAVCLATGAANAQSLLLNGDFETPQATGWIGTDWTSWAWGNGWSAHEIKNNIPGQMNGGNGTYLLNAGGMGWNGGGGAWQTVSANAGMQYTLTVDSGADAWWQPNGYMSMTFFDASNVDLGGATRNTVDPAVYGGITDIPHPMLNYSLDAIAPVGTTAVKVEFSGNNLWGGSVTFDNGFLSMSAIPEPSTVALFGLGAALLIVNRFRRGSNRA